MESKKCQSCGLVNFPDAETCKRCNSNLKTGQFNRNLFNCPDCGNSCSVTAISCPQCGRVLKSVPVHTAEEPKKTSPAAWFVLLAIIVVPIFRYVARTNYRSTSGNSTPVSASSGSTSVSSAPISLKANDPEDFNNSAGRQRFANGLHGMARQNGKSTVFVTEGLDQKTLVMEGNDLLRSDCSLIADSDYGKSAAGIGFEKVTCRNKNEGSTWTLTLSR